MSSNPSQRDVQGKYRFLIILFLISISFHFLINIAYAESSWSSVGRTAVSRSSQKSIALSNGFALIAGGARSGQSVNFVEVFKPSSVGTGSWSLVQSMNHDRKYFTLNLITSEDSVQENVLAVGGVSDSCSCTRNTAELYNATTNIWTFVPNMNQARWGHSSSMLDNSKVLVVGGSADSNSVVRLTSVELYDSKLNKWVLKSPLHIARTSHQQVTYKDVMGNTKVMVIGGNVSTSTQTPSTEIYDPLTDTWSFGPSMAYARGNYFSAVLLHDGRILVTGNDAPGFNQSEIYEPRTNSWSTVTQYYKVDRLHESIVLGSSAGYKVLLAGGIDVLTGDATVHSQIFDPDNNSWSQGGSMLTPRYGFSLTLMNDGSVLASDGYNNTIGDLLSAELYHPTEVLGVSVAPTPSPTLTPNPTPTPTIIPTPTPSPMPSVSPTPAPFLDLPWDYKSKNQKLNDIIMNPGTWFDHEYPLQNTQCCVLDTRVYSGEKKSVYYKSHSGYDYNLGNQLAYKDSVIAAASGSAIFVPESKSGGGGNMIKIDHGNGYQTWYEHLDLEGILTLDESAKIFVNRGDKIGEVGFTGNIVPRNKFGAHLHFSVFNDLNGNGNFQDDYPYGLMDPLGWEPQKNEKNKDIDPWTKYGAPSSHGATSYSLFLNQSIPTQSVVQAVTGGSLKAKEGSVEVQVPSDALPLDLTIHYSDGPYETVGNLHSIVPSFFLDAYNSLGDSITNFLKPIKITYKYEGYDASNTDESTIKMYYYNIQTLHWDPMVSNLDRINKIVTAETDHFTHFALMGDVKDSSPPTTSALLIGDKGIDNYYRSDVNLTLKSVDDVSGVKSTLYTEDDNNWPDYSNPLVFQSEGNYKILYQSSDNVDNVEDIKSTTFSIDKTNPISDAVIQGEVQKLNDWYTSGINIALNSNDSGSGVAKTEYSLDYGENFAVYSGEIWIDKQGVNDLMYRSTDKAGNIEEAKTIQIKIDKTAPSTTTYTSGSAGINDWYRSNVRIEFDASDFASGYNKTYFSLNNGESYEEYIDPIVISQEGVSKVFYYSVDNAGNREVIKSMEIKIDKTPPVVTIDAAPHSMWSPNSKMFDVRVTGSISDEHLSKKSFAVLDEYKLVELIFTGFNQVIRLQARRNDSDYDGRLYIIQANAEDLAGNRTTAQTKVIVLHDQGK